MDLIKSETVAFFSSQKVLLSELCPHYGPRCDVLSRANLSIGLAK